MKLATRIILLIALITLLMGMLTIIFSAPVIKQGFQEIDHEWTKSLTGSLSEGIANDTINGNASRVRQIIEAVVLKNKELEYAYVVDFEQRLFAHTFKEGFPQKLFNTATSTDEQLTTLQLDGKKIEDISYPIIDGMSARLHLGLSEESDVALLKKIDQKLIIIIFTLGLVGIAIAFPLSRQLTKPLEQFGNLMQDYGSNRVKGQIEIPKGSVEILTLGKTFNQMIKDRALADKALQQFKGTLDQTLDCVFMFDAEELNFFYVNEGALQQVGYSFDELQTMHPYDIRPEVSEQQFHELITPLLSGEKASLNFETVHQHKNGKKVCVEIFLQYIAPENESARFVAIVRDITERKKIEQMLELNTSRLNVAQHIAKVGSWELNLLNNELIWSDETFHMFEIDKNQFEASYEDFLNAIHPDDREAVNKAYTDSLVDRKPYEIVHRLQMNDGTIKHVREKCESHFDEDGKPIRSMGTVQDITEIYIADLELEKHRKHLEDMVEERTKELSDTQDELVRKGRLATLGQLTATVSHELRNPLGAMRPSLYVIKKKSDESDERVQNAIARVDRNIDRCDRIIDELLDFTRITELNLESVNIDEWLESVIDDQLVPEGIQIEKDFDLKYVSLDIDKDRLRRVIINVFENACHSMMDDNQKLVNSENAHVNIKTRTNDERLEITITDSGAGIPKEILDKIFEPLFSTKGFGVGLGMPTVKQIIEQHFGGIEIESEEGKGTSVILWLPMNVKK